MRLYVIFVKRPKDIFKVLLYYTIDYKVDD